MTCSSSTTGAYRPRQPKRSPLYQILEQHFDRFEQIYPERYQKRYGLWRSVIRTAVEAFLKCGDLHEGFARVKCPECQHEMFVAFSCRQRCVCPTCHQKRTLLTAIHITEDVCEPVRHVQFVFTIPKRFRVYFRYNRHLLGHLPRLAWQVVQDVYHAVLGRDDVVPGMIGSIHTWGALLHWHPHVHCLVSDGAFLPDRTFLPLPSTENEPFLKLWEHKIFQLLLAEGRINQNVVEQMQSWRHSGFSVDRSVVIEAGDQRGLERVTQYMVRCPFSLERIVCVTDAGKVIYRSENGNCQSFTDPSSDQLLPGIRRNFQLFDPLDFIAELTQHIPDKGTHLDRRFGFYSNKSRGARARQAADHQHDDTSSVQSLTDADENAAVNNKQARRRWAALIKRVYESDPLTCPKCLKGQMRFVSLCEVFDYVKSPLGRASHLVAV